MYKEYPCGLILLWKPPEEVVSRLNLRDFAVEKKDSLSTKNPSYLVLDGQQRLTSILKVLNGEVNVYFNVDEEKFEIYSPKLKGQPMWVSVSDVMKDGAIKAWLELKEKMGDGLDERKCLERLSKLERIKDYTITVEILHTDDYEEITEAFIRVNSKGTKLREAELALAQLAFHLPGVVSDDFEKTLYEYDRKDFEFEARFLMRCFVAISTGQSRFRYLGSLWKSDKTQLMENWKKTRKGLDYTINFLRNNVGIESSD